MTRPDKPTLVALVFTTLIGLGIRLAVVLPSAFPLNDGGLFYQMIADLTTNSLRLPAFTTYNSASIPFAYPPLPFYFYAVLHLILRVPLIELVQYGPPILSAASIPAFFFLADDVLGSRVQAALGTLIFALLPRAFDWLIMGGGVTRSLGMLFALLAMRQTLHLFGDRRPQAILPTAVLGSVLVYSHPEAAVHTAVTALVFYLSKDRSRRGLINGCAAAGGIALLTAPWWGTVLARHGLNPFLSAAEAASQGSYSPLAGLLALVRFDFADEPFIALLTVLGLVGMAFELARRKYLLPAWLLSMYVLEPRGGPTFMMVPLAMCGGIALHEVILAPLGRLNSIRSSSARQASEIPSDWLGGILSPGAARAFLGFVLIYGAFGAYATGLRISQNFTLSAQDLQAFAWVESSTPASSRFALVTQELPLRDAVSEWFPALTQRQSVATVFGHEWITAADFATTIQRYQSLQECASRGAECLQAWELKYDSGFDYLLIRHSAGTSNVALSSFLSSSPDYEQVYRSQTVEIFKRVDR